MPFESAAEIQGARRPARLINGKVSEDLMTLLRALLESDPRDRPTMKRARESFDWLKSYIT